MRTGGQRQGRQPDCSGVFGPGAGIVGAAAVRLQKRHGLVGEGLMVGQATFLFRLSLLSFFLSFSFFFLFFWGGGMVFFFGVHILTVITHTWLFDNKQTRKKHSFAFTR